MIIVENIAEQEGFITTIMALANHSALRIRVCNTVDTTTCIIPAFLLTHFCVYDHSCEYTRLLARCVIAQCTLPSRTGFF